MKLDITSFFDRQSLYDFDTILYPEDFLKIDYLISKSLFWSFKLEIQINQKDRTITETDEVESFLLDSDTTNK